MASQRPISVVMMKGCEAILLIEDEPADVLLIKLTLERLRVPAPVLSVGDGLEALEYLEGRQRYADRARFPFPRLLLLDLQMPRMDGFDFLTWLRAEPRFRCLPVIVIANSAFSKDVTRAYRAGANSFLVKSIDFGQFTSELRHTLNFWLVEHPVRWLPPDRPPGLDIDLPPRAPRP